MSLSREPQRDEFHLCLTEADKRFGDVVCWRRIAGLVEDTIRKKASA
ncbi:unnamed protein product [Klebsiella pneumoniae]|nr:unnamed protein product [Klebsiella pneumoniae]